MADVTERPQGLGFWCRSGSAEWERRAGVIYEYQKIRDGRIVEHCGGSNSLEVLLGLGLVKWNTEGLSPSGGRGTASGSSGGATRTA